ncbi:uncharacterized protein LOC129906762 [Episyrphus balteatus]|uniref:uncharacterized protein LOC129906762 n=1 Tax=Episyrphus balteatus TaxID=286459 RepID=UPI002484FC93|nr:uncharacterized protein LOC129906762 [Episyrphus balteatus]
MEDFCTQSSTNTMTKRSKTQQVAPPTPPPPPPQLKGNSPAATVQKRSKPIQSQQKSLSTPPPSRISSPGVMPPKTNNVSGDRTSYLTLSTLEERLNKHTSMIINRITSELSKIRSELFERIEQTVNIWTDKLNKVNTTITEIINRVECIEAKSFDALTLGLDNKLATASTTITDLVRRVDIIEGKSADMRELGSKVSSLQQHIDESEKKEIAADAVLFGVPCLPEENLTLIFNRLCSTANCKPTSIKNIFRSRSRNSASPVSPPVIIKFACVQEKYSTLKSITVYRKKKQNNQLSLRDLGMDSDKACFLNESLSKNTRTLLHHAIRMRNNHQLFNAYTKHGSVFIKLTCCGKFYHNKFQRPILKTFNLFPTPLLFAAPKYLKSFKGPGPSARSLLFEHLGNATPTGLRAQIGVNGGSHLSKINNRTDGPINNHTSKLEACV